jgi:hypothetical protein
LTSNGSNAEPPHWFVQTQSDVPTLKCVITEASESKNIFTDLPPRGIHLQLTAGTLLQEMEGALHTTTKLVILMLLFLVGSRL